MARTGVNIYKRKDGRYEGRYQEGFKEDGKPKYHSVYGHSYEEVEHNVTSIGAHAFRGCSLITGTLDIPKATTIGESAFMGCSGLTGSLTIPDSMTTIGNTAFQNCSGLTGDLTIGSGVTSIGTNAFSGCGFTGDLTIKGGKDFSINRKMFSNSDNTPLPFTGDLTLGTSDENSGLKTLAYTSEGGTFQGFGFKGKLTILLGEHQIVLQAQAVQAANFVDEAAPSTKKAWEIAYEALDYEIEKGTAMQNYDELGKQYDDPFDFAELVDKN